MKKLLTIPILSFFIIVSYSNSYSSTTDKKIDEINKMFVTGVISNEECINLKKVILGENSEPKCQDDKKNSITFKSPSIEKEKFTVIYQLNLLGSFNEPNNYPEGMIEFFGKKCLKFDCRATKATKKMSFVFKKRQKYQQKNPGEQLYAMAMFELFYQQQIQKNQNRIEEFFASWPDKNKYANTIVSLIKLNKAREQMRKSLGMDLNTNIEEAMERFWLMGDFLEKGEIKKQKISKEINKRGLLLAKYKKAVTDFKLSIQNQKYEELYDEIKQKNN